MTRILVENIYQQQTLWVVIYKRSQNQMHSFSFCTVLVKSTLHVLLQQEFVLQDKFRPVNIRKSAKWSESAHFLTQILAKIIQNWRFPK